MTNEELQALVGKLTQQTGEAIETAEELKERYNRLADILEAERATRREFLLLTLNEIKRGNIEWLKTETIAELADLEYEEHQRKMRIIEHIEEQIGWNQ